MGQVRLFLVTPTIAAREAKSFPREKVLIGYRVFSQGNVVNRSSSGGDELNWDEQSEYNLGKVVIDVPNAAIVHSIVSCAGIAQHFWWLLDPSAAQNSRRAIYDGFDQNLT